MFNIFRNAKLRDFSEQSVEEDQFAVTCEGKLTFLAEASPEPKMNFAKTKLNQNNILNRI